MRTTETLTFLDLFAGIGGFRLGMEMAGHRCVGYCEIDKFARMSYKAIFNTKSEVEMHDITTITDEFIRSIGHVDVLCGGFPCQAFSVAGSRKGFSDTRGTLFFQIARFARILRPKYLFLENVKGLLNHAEGDTFETIIRTLDELGYDCEWSCLNSRDYVPQNRERLFIIGHSRNERTNVIFPFARHEKSSDSPYRIQKIGNIRQLGRSQSGDVVSTEGIAPTLCSTTTQKDPLKIVLPMLSPDRLNTRQNGRRLKTAGEDMFTLTAQDRHGILIAGTLPGNYAHTNRVYAPAGISPTLTTMQGGQQEPKILVSEATKTGFTEAMPGDSINLSHPKSKTRRGHVGKQTANTILTGSEQAALLDSFNIRKLTPLECWRLQAFPDWAFLAAKFGSREIAKEILAKHIDHYNCKYEQKMSNSQLYKQAGNSVTVAVIHDIAKRLS